MDPREYSSCSEFLHVEEILACLSSTPVDLGHILELLSNQTHAIHAHVFWIFFIAGHQNLAVARDILAQTPLQFQAAVKRNLITLALEADCVQEQVLRLVLSSLSNDSLCALYPSGTETPLHVTAWINNPAWTREFLARGISATAPNHSNETALDVAQWARSCAVADILRASLCDSTRRSSRARRTTTRFGDFVYN